jgi:hypothetical protein
MRRAVMDKLVELRDGLQEYSCTCIANAYAEMGQYGAEWGAIKHLYLVLCAWDVLDREVTRLAEEE